MVSRNPHIATLKSGYLFPEIRKRKEAFLAENPDAKVISLGIGNTTEPLGPIVTNGLRDAALGLGTKGGYSGYGPEEGDEELRALIAEKMYGHAVSQDDIFISDGSKCDVGRLQILFGSNVTIAMQDPVYPAYNDTSIIMGQQGIVTMGCTPDNDFFPKELPKTDLIFFCSPNNPTGATATKEQLERLVKHAQKNSSIIIFDAAYAAYIQDHKLPRSIYEIPGAEEVAIEMGSFSKMAGFTGVRLGWTVVPEALKFKDGSSVKKDWHRIISTFFNGASNIARAGGCIALSDKGMCEIEETIAFYLENAKIIAKALKKSGYQVYGGVHVPYLWTSLPPYSSWELFEKMLQEQHLLTVPGSGFGPSGEGFVRISAYSHRSEILEAAARIESYVLHI